MVKLSDLSDDDLHSQMEALKEKLRYQGKWLHRSRQYKAFLTEIAIRSGYATTRDEYKLIQERAAIKKLITL